MAAPVLGDRLVIDSQDLARLQTATVDPRRVEAVIAAAGRGTRLGLETPKVLLHIDGETLLVRLLTRLTGLADRVTLVVSPSGRSAIEAAIPSPWHTPVRIAEQATPTGMADAVLAGGSGQQEEVPATPSLSTVLVIWGDQAGLGQRTLRLALLAHQQHPARPALTLPVAEMEQPYVHYVIDEAHRVTTVLQQREGDALPPHGLADCGCFVAERGPLLRALLDLRGRGELVGRVTGEQNFLPVVPYLGRQGKVLVVKCAALSDTIGINTAADLDRMRTSGDETRGA